MKILLLVLAFITILVSSILLYPESVRIMRGDYILGRWIGVVETNKSYFLLFFLAIVGGCIGYISVYISRRLKRSGKED